MTITAAAYTGELPTLSNVTENVPTISAVEVQQKRITELAYYKDEKRGFGPWHEHEDWLEAESNIIESE